MKSPQREISVVIPNYNGRQLLEKNLPSVILALSKIKGNHEIIVPDDASTDDSINFLKANYPDILIVENKTNKGFSPNINSGIFRATKELVFALNSDVWLMEDYFIPLMDYFDDDDTFGVMGKIIDLEGDKIQDGAKYPEKKGFQIKSTLNYIIENEHINGKVPTFFLSGANALMNTKKLIEIGGYNEIYAPFYVEDVDISLTAWRLGWKCYYENKAVCRHPVSVTITKHSKKNFVKTISIRNQMILQELHLQGLSLIGWRLQLLFNVMTKWLTLKPNFYKALILFLKKRNNIIESKSKFKSIFSKHDKNFTIEEIIESLKKDIECFSIKKF